MSQNYEFYDARAKEAKAEAEAATLDNVRNRALRSENAWRDMAARAKQMEIDREEARLQREQRQAEADQEADTEARDPLATPAF